jgi:DNA processing protein
LLKGGGVVDNTIEDGVDKRVALAISGIGGARRARLLERLGGGEKLRSLSEHLSSGELRRGGDILERCAVLSIKVITFADLQYPAALRAIPLPPAALFIRARRDEIEIPEDIIGVVGTRDASVEMCQQASSLAAHLARAGFCVVSGLALGVDGAAHRGALLAGRKTSTIAVVAHGLNATYPPSHEPLAENILEGGGMIISEYPPGSEPLKHHFLERNRIIAGLARGLVVVQAGERSGSLVTARYAADYGRDVFVFEGPHGDTRHTGGERLIEDGAIAISGAREILEEYHVTSQDEGEALTSSSERWETLALDQYLERTKHSPSVMLRLEMEGRVVRLPGNRVSVLLE